MSSYPTTPETSGVLAEHKECLVSVGTTGALHKIRPKAGAGSGNPVMRESLGLLEGCKPARSTWNNTRTLLACVDELLTDRNRKETAKAGSRGLDWPIQSTKPISPGQPCQANPSCQRNRPQHGNPTKPGPGPHASNRPLACSLKTRDDLSQALTAPSRSVILTGELNQLFRGQFLCRKQGNFHSTQHMRPGGFNPPPRQIRGPRTRSKILA